MTFFAKLCEKLIFRKRGHPPLLLLLQLYYSLINKSQVSNISPILSPLIIIFTLLIGFFYFKETLKKNELVGILIVILGIYVIKSNFCKNNTVIPVFSKHFFYNNLFTYHL